MIDAGLLFAFIPAALALNFTPGADMMFCLAQGLKSGPRAAMAANLGIAIGGMIHVALAGVGLGALIVALPHAFDAIRWAGVAYLLWLAWRALRQPPGTPSATGIVATSPMRAFREALLVNLTNPKVILFVLALLPQFTRADLPLLPQFLILGGVLSVGGLVINGAVGLYAGSLGRRLATSPRFALWLSRVTATIFASLAVRLALLGKQA